MAPRVEYPSRWHFVVFAVFMLCVTSAAHVSGQPVPVPEIASRLSSKSPVASHDEIRRLLPEVTTALDGAIALHPNDPIWLNMRAWLLATCEFGEFRNGSQALDDSRRACGFTEWKNAVYLDTFAAASAETDNFDDAVRWQKQALMLANDKDKSDYEARLTLYENNKPYRVNCDARHISTLTMQCGTAYFNKKRYGMARDIYTLAVECDPTNALAWYSRAYNAFFLKQHDQRVVDLSEAISLDSGNILYLNQRAAALNKLQRYEEALIDAEKALNIAPGNYDAASNAEYARCCLVQQASPQNAPRFEGLQADWSRVRYLHASAKEPARARDAEMYYLWAFVKEGDEQLSANNARTALTHYTTAMYVHTSLLKGSAPFNCRARKGRADAFLAMGRFDEAFEEQKQIASTKYWRPFDPSRGPHRSDNSWSMWPRPLHWFVDPWIERKEYDRATELATLLLTNHGKRRSRRGSVGLNTQWKRAQIHELAGYNKLAQRDYDELIEAFAELPFPHKWRAAFHHRNGRWAQAIEDYAVAISLAHDYDVQNETTTRASIYMSRAKLWQDKGKLHKAIADYDAALEAQPKLVEAIRGKHQANVAARAQGAEDPLGDFESLLADLEAIDKALSGSAPTP